MENKNNESHFIFIFIFILDAVRKDHLGVYGYKRNTSPNIDLLAKNSEIYNWVISPSSYTHSAVPSMLSGKYPFELNDPFYSWNFKKSDLLVIRSVRKLGYKVALFTAHISSSSKGTNLTKYIDFHCNELSTSEKNRNNMLVGRSEDVIIKLQKFVSSRKKQKWLVIVHLMEAHGPYESNYKSIFLNDAFYNRDKRTIQQVVFDDFRNVTNETLKKRVIPRYQLYNVKYDQHNNIEDYDSNVRQYLAHYDMGIYTQDKSLGTFFQYLKKNKLYDKSTVTITSDHGELIGEDNIFFSHGIYTHPALINVPFIIKWSNQKNSSINNENFSTQYLFQKLLYKLKPNSTSTYLNNEGFLSFNSQGFSYLKDDYLYMMHNGDYHFSGSLYNVLLPIWTFTNNDLLNNYKELNINPHIKIFRKKNNIFSEIKTISKDKFNYLVIKLLQIIKYVSNHVYNQQVNILKQKQKKLENIKQLQETNTNKLKNENRVLINKLNQLSAELNRIYSSKTWKTLYFYKNVEDKVKNIFNFKNETN